MGKLLSDAGKCGARSAIILDQGIGDRQVTLKDLAGGEQETLAVDALAERIQTLVSGTMTE